MKKTFWPLLLTFDVNLLDCHFTPKWFPMPMVELATSCLMSGSRWISLPMAWGWRSSLAQPYPSSISYLFPLWSSLSYTINDPKNWGPHTAGACVSWQTAEEGSVSTIYCAVADETEGISGKYFDSDCALVLPSSTAQDPALALKSFEYCEKLTSKL